jgi:Ion channel
VQAAEGLETGDVSRAVPEARYEAVFLCAAAALVVLVMVPTTDWTRALALLFECLALFIAVATGGGRVQVRRTRATVVGVVALLLIAAAAAGALAAATVSALSAIAALSASAAITGGLVRLVRQRGVTLQAVAGALAIYLQLGLMFAWLIGFVAHVDGAPFFAQGGDGSQSERVYYSFTVLTTTGFGDLTAAESIGRGLAVVEMLAGQLYLVTVIGLLVGGLVGRRRA